MFDLKIWQHYLYKMKWNMYMNHKSLKYFFTQKKLNKRQQRCLKLVKDYYCNIWYPLSKANVVVDELSKKVVLSHITIYREL